MILISLEKKQGFERLLEVTQQEYLRLGFKLRSVWLQSTFWNYYHFVMTTWSEELPSSLD